MRGADSMNKMNKKGATTMTTVLLVVMTLVLIGFSLFTFLTEKPKIKSDFNEFMVLGKVYSAYDAANFYFNALSTDAFNKAYGSLQDKNNLEELKAKFIENVGTALDRSFADVQLVKIKNRVKNKEYELKTENGVLFFSLNSFIISDADSETKTAVIYEADLKFESLVKEKV